MQYPHMGSLAGDRVDYYYFVADSGERRWPSSGSGSSDSRSSDSGSGSSTNGCDGRSGVCCPARPSSRQAWSRSVMPRMHLRHTGAPLARQLMRSGLPCSCLAWRLGQRGGGGSRGGGAISVRSATGTRSAASSVCIHLCFHHYMHTVRLHLDLHRSGAPSAADLQPFLPRWPRLSPHRTRSPRWNFGAHHRIDSVPVYIQL